jgi:drug/metabolite transporter (DMT)-like permease
MTRRGWLLFFAMGIIWGLPYLLIRVSVREVSPAFLVFVRTGGGALLLSPLAIRRGALRPLLAHWRPVVAYTVVELAVPWLVLFTAEKRVSSSLAALLVAAVPIAGAIIATLKGTDQLDRRRLAGLALGVAGVVALVGFDVAKSNLLAASSFLLVVIGYALGPWLLSRYLSELPSVTVIIASLVLCAVVYAPFAYLERPVHPLSTSVVLSMLALTSICTALAFVAFFALIGEVGPMRSTVVTYINPAVAVVLGVAVLGESFGVATAAGFVAVLGGSFLATRPLRLAAAIDDPDAPDFPEAPGFPDPPGFPDNPGFPDSPGFPETPGFPDAPAAADAPGVPVGPHFPDAPGVPVGPRFPDAPGFPQRPGFPESPSLPDEPGVPDGTGFPETPGFPDAPGVPDGLGVPVGLGFPEGPGLLFGPGSPERPEVFEVSEVDFPEVASPEVVFESAAVAQREAGVPPLAIMSPLDGTVSALGHE